ncbi:MAG: HAMP domain-containing sensor histidine kinase, partial [Acidobacteriota bacterium]
MALGQIRDFLLPGMAEMDPVFRYQIQRLSHQGLRVIGAVGILLPLLLTGIEAILMPELITGRVFALRAGSMAVIGLIASLIALTNWSRPRARGLALIAGFASAAVLVGTTPVVTRDVPWAPMHIPTGIVTVLLVTMAVIPLRPMQTLAFGLAIEAIHLAVSLVSRRQGLLADASLDAAHHFWVLVLVLLCTALTALIYAERVAAHRAHQEALRNYDELCKMRAQAAVAESAASLARLVAAFSHELNTPVGALRSAVDTLLVVGARQATAPPSEQTRLRALQNDLRKSVSDSVERLRAVVARMQRLTNLDKADVQEANLNELLSDVAALLEPQARGRVKLELELEPLPPLVCKPQQLSAVFSNLLSNAVEAIDGQGRVTISTHRASGRAEILIRDNGRGMDGHLLATIFDPGFRVAANHVSTGHWSLFGSRQIVREHGGEITISSEQGKGSTVRLTLP